MDAPIHYYENFDIQAGFNKYDAIIDALIGYRLRGSPRDNYGKVIELINKFGKKVFSYDIPTGIESTSGKCSEPFVRADVTLTLGLPKKAFKNGKVREVSGELFLGDIGIPNFIYNKIAQNSRPDFNKGLGLIKI